jgi:endonuclease YncB( thermonuclease family)
MDNQQQTLADEFIIELLETTELDLNNTKKYIPDIHYGKVIKVYDGDTITIATQLYNGSLVPKKEMYKFNIRISGIDTPEIKSSNVAERELAILARDALSNIVMGKVVRLEDISHDKYGRLLCNVFVDDINIAKWMIEHDYAMVYNGGTKHTWD